MSTTRDARSETEAHAAPREAWDAIAEGFDRYVAPQEAELASEALRMVGLEAGERLLDVAAGTGGLSLPAARLGAEVLATDWSPGDDGDVRGACPRRGADQRRGSCDGLPRARSP